MRTVTILHVPSSLATGIGPEMAHEFSLGILKQELPPVGTEPKGCKFAVVAPRPQLGDRACLQTERMRRSPGRTAQIGGVRGILSKAQVCASLLSSEILSAASPVLLRALETAFSLILRATPESYQYTPCLLKLFRVGVLSFAIL